MSKEEIEVEVPYEDFIDLQENLAECMCGNYAHYKYMRYDDDGNPSCPNCQISYMGEIIKNLTKLVKEVADPELDEQSIINMIKLKYGEIYGINDIEELEFIDVYFYDNDDEE